MTTAFKQNIKIRRGDSFNLMLRLSGTPNPVGATVRSHIKRSANATTSLWQWDGLLVQDAPDGPFVHLPIDAIDTATFRPGQYVYDIEITFPEGGRHTLVEGNVDVVEDVTQ